jgi:hypothetical protein
MSFTVFSATEIPATSTRITKTYPLRTALLQLLVGEAIEVAYDTHDAETGYKVTTISQVAGTMSAKSESVRYSVKKKPDGSGCYLIAVAKPEPGTQKRRGRKPTA